MDNAVDVLIVGGGPAGLAAGITLAGCGLRTLVCEQKRYPVDKPCGEGIMPTGVAALERLGVKPHLPQDRYFPLDGIKYVARSGRTAIANFSEGPAWGMPRAELSRALLRRASQMQKLEVREGRDVQLERHLPEDPPRGPIRASVGGETVSARLLIGADGLNSAVRRWAGLAGGRGKWRRWGARQHFRVEPWCNFVEVHWGPGLEAYVTPCGEKLVGVAFLWNVERCEAPEGGKGLIPSLLSHFPELETRLQRASTVDAPGAVGPLQRVSRGVVAPGTLLIGDAAGYLDALTGEGISLALAEALVLKETVVPRLLDSGRAALSIPELSAYAQAYKAIVKPYYRMTGLLLELGQYPSLVETSIRILGRRPALFSRLLSANMGEISLARALLGSSREAIRHAGSSR